MHKDVIFICSQYSCPSGDLDADMNDYNYHFPNFNHVLSGSDFNVPLMDFDYTHQNDKTDILVEHLAEKDLYNLNDSDAPYSFVWNSLVGRPDLTLGGHNICNKIENWSVDVKKFPFSDRRYITYNMTQYLVKRNNFCYKTKNKSFNKFNRKTKDLKQDWLSQLLSVYTPDDLDVHVKNFTIDIINISNSCFKLGNISF